jgi:hypothetical protein
VLRVDLVGRNHGSGKVDIENCVREKVGATGMKAWRLRRGWQGDRSGGRRDAILNGGWRLSLGGSIAGRKGEPKDGGREPAEFR